MTTTPASLRPLRIVHLTAGSDAGGVSRYLFDLCSALHAAGHHVSIAGQRGAWHGLFETAAFPWIDLPLKGGPLALRRAAGRLADVLSNGPPVDVLHAHYRRAALVGRRLQRLLPAPPPLLYTLHLSHLSLRWPRRMLSDFGDHTHVAASESRQWMIESAGVAPGRITLIPHGIDPTRFPVTTPALRAAARQQLHLRGDDVVAAFVGRFDTPKNEQWMLDLAAAARGKLPRLKVLLLGEGPHESALWQRIERDHLADRVQLLTHRRDPLPIYYAADALLLPSQREGFSFVCAEAMSCGIPVLRTRTAGAAEQIIENQTGRSVPINHDAFIAAALEMLGDPAALPQMGAHAAAHVRTHLTFDQQLHATLALYRNLARPH